MTPIWPYTADGKLILPPTKVWIKSKIGPIERQINVIEWHYSGKWIVGDRSDKYSYSYWATDCYSTEEATKIDG